MEIRFDNLSFAYRRKAAPALTSVSAAVGPGLHLLLGENGAGKTTLLHIIAGLRFPSTGTCTIDGCPTRLRLPSINSRLFLTGSGMEFPARTINEMKRIHSRFYPSFSQQQLADNLAAFGLTGDEKLPDLSCGDSQKSRVAYALALNTDVLLLDEPANGLDIESKSMLQNLMARQIRPEQTVIVSTHTVADLEHLYDGVIDLSHGSLTYAMPVDEILRRVCFAVSDDLPADAIFSETRIGLRHSILPNPDGAYSDPDYRLLYMAVRTPGSAEIIKSLLQ